MSIRVGLGCLFVALLSLGCGQVTGDVDEREGEGMDPEMGQGTGGGEASSSGGASGAGASTGEGNPGGDPGSTPNPGVGDEPVGDYFVRVGYVQGQEGTRDFCVAHELGADGYPVWEPEGLLERFGYEPEQFEGLDKVSRYLPLERAPIAVGKTGVGCSEWVNAAYVPAGDESRYFTFLSVPYSFEPDMVWLVSDPDPELAPMGVRIVNATTESRTIDVATDEGWFLGEFEFGNSPTEFQRVEYDHMAEMDVTFLADMSYHLSWIHVDLLPLYGTTVYVSGHSGSKLTALGCVGTNPSLQGSDYSNCYFSESE